MLFFDFEVFRYDWLVVIYDMAARQDHVIINDPDKLKAFYEAHRYDIWVGYNSRSYDNYILKAILCDFNPYEVSQWIIVKGRAGWQFSNLFNKIHLYSYDTMPNVPVGLKTMEGMMGNDIEETSVPFDINRRLTDLEIAQTVKYCRHDVENTILVFIQRKSDFDAVWQLCQEFKLPLTYLKYTNAQITAKALQCVRQDWTDEYDFIIEPFIKLKKYKAVLDWFRDAKEDCIDEMEGHYLFSPPYERYKYDRNDPEAFRKYFYSRSITTIICGVPHVDGWGGIHGAPTMPLYRSGAIYHVDVGSYYPSYLIAHNRITRAARAPQQYADVYHRRMALKAAGKKREQAPYKLLLNSLSGAMKDPHNAAYDPCMNNTMVVNCQLMLIMLLEWLEEIDGFELIQSNTDGLIVKLPETEAAYNQFVDICHRWEDTCSTDACKIALAFDRIEYIYQKDVNNYIFKHHGKEQYDRKGAYVKELSQLDADLPIVNSAVVEYLTHGIHPRFTINRCDDLRDFQKLVKLSSKYEWVEHNGQRYTNKCYRVYASRSSDDGTIYKCKQGKRDKFANTPDQCRIVNTSVEGLPCPSWLDKQYYINLSLERLRQFGVRM